MIYGLYLSASGVMSSSYKQDVIANNLANAETAGFKRDLPLFQQRMTEAEAARAGKGRSGWSDSILEGIGGGLLVSKQRVDTSPGTLEHTSAPLDVSIQGDGFFAVRAKSGTEANAMALTRNGQFMIDGEGYMVLGNDRGQRVMDTNRQPIRVTADGGPLHIGSDGAVSQGKELIGQIGVFNVDDTSKLQKMGGTLLGYSEPSGIRRVDSSMQAEFLERSNVDPTTELTDLMKTQRLLEANAQMIRYQDQTLGKLIEVGKI
ncbi:flagellar hook-basal body protein [Humisphaera borealis]|uniref:Flagellar hook-basal body protein n=1 Tax=Humisphaera borealis TaxID=2807512 RepID=A0A7M2X1F7_9BACT|nr:flagellar hook-basal body protein [Humisphaera borealis]QOV91533.1 flagellar hook-basal body protein [Humisphaera borealis]